MLRATRAAETTGERNVAQSSAKFRAPRFGDWDNYGTGLVQINIKIDRKPQKVGVVTLCGQENYWRFSIWAVIWIRAAVEKQARHLYIGHPHCFNKSLGVVAHIEPLF